MRKWYRNACLLAAILGGCTLSANADDGKASSADVERLQALLEAQQKELGDLRQQVAAQSTTNVDKARTDDMRAQIRAILGEAEFRDSLMKSTMSAGYDDGFYIRSSDNAFSIKFNGLFEFRYTYYETRETNHYLTFPAKRDDRSGFELTRTRVGISGNAGKDWTYELILKSEAATGYNTVLHHAWVNYAWSPEWQFRAGMMGLNTTRTSMVADNGKQFAEHGVFDAVFNLGTGVGVAFWGSCMNKHLDWDVQVVNGTSDGGNTNGGAVINPDPAQLDGNPALLFRTTWHALGDKPGTHFRTEGDIDHLSSPALDIGFHYAFNDDNFDSVGDTRTPVQRIRPFGIPGGFALVNTNGMQFHQFGLDAGLKYCGFSLYGEYVCRVMDVRRGSFENGPLAPWYVASGDNSTTAQHGGYVQSGWFLPIAGLEKKLEAVARVGGMTTMGNDDYEGTMEYAAGMNYYIDGNRVKLQGDVTKVNELPISSNYHSYANVNDDALIFRLQLSMSF